MLRNLLSSSSGVLVGLTLLFSIPTLPLSILNHDRELKWLGISCTIATFLYHCSIIFLTYRDARTADSNSQSASLASRYSSTAGLVWAFAILCLWVIASITNIQDTANGPGGLLYLEINAAWHYSIQIAGCVVMGVESVLWSTLVAYSTIRRRSEQQQHTADVEKIFNLSRTNTIASQISTNLAGGHNPAFRFSVDSIPPSRL